MPPLTPGSHTHEQWLDLVQPVGLVVAPAVLNALQLFPNQRTAYLAARQRQLEALLEERESAASEPIQVVPSFQLLATELLDWGEADLISADQLETCPQVPLAEYGETLRPSHAVPKFEGEGLQAMVLDLTAQGEWGRDFDAPWDPTSHGWDATPQQRFERLLLAVRRGFREIRDPEPPPGSLAMAGLGWAGCQGPAGWATAKHRIEQRMAHHQQKASWCAGNDHSWRQVELADAPGEAAVVEGGDRLAASATGVMQRISEIQTRAQACHGLLQGGAVLQLKAGMVQQLLEHQQHLLGREAVVATQHPFQLQRHGLWQE